LRSLLGPELSTSPRPPTTNTAILPWPQPGENPCVSIPTTMGHNPLGRRIVRRLQKQGYRVHVWTVNEETEMHRLIDYGVDGIMTDDCELLKSVLESRGRWV
ncbi:MAG: glycerophosphodiester phosphodiesterase family protein, partial [Acidimicrobiales bacterium]